MRLSYRAELRPTPQQMRALLQHAGNARWAYNWGLAKHKEAYGKWVELGKPKKWGGWPNAMSLHRELNALKKAPVEDGGVPWMYEASKCAPQEALRDLDKAFKGFLSGRTKYPRFKSRNKGVGGFRLTGTVSIDERCIQLPVVGKIRLQPGERGYIPQGRYAQASVTEHAGKWFVSVVGIDVPDTRPNGNPSVGVDLGVVNLATLSNGEVIPNPLVLKSRARKLKHLQQEVSRKARGSKNRAKAVMRLKEAHSRVANTRKDALHKATTYLAKSHGKVVIEDLKVRNMTRAGKGKRGLNRSVLDASFGEFRKMLEYKGARYGCEVVAVNPAYTSQRCSACGHVERGNRKTQAEFECLSCGFTANADLNAAKNILEAASLTDSLNACGGDVRLGGNVEQT
ncbi:MAG: transposase, partial [Actinobacteria bacterium]|nr:transposase [Actinomycetota bacterium]NBR67130.1 transposase [Actinomycetota bacterium]